MTTNLNTMTSAERHISSLMNNGVSVKRPDGTKEPITMGFYRKAVEQCRTGGYNAVTYELELPGIDGDFQIVIWRDGHADSGSTRRIIQSLASR